MNADIKSLKIGKTPGEDDIRPEMLKAMNKYVRWLTRVSKVTCRTGQAMVNQCDNTHPQESRPQKMHQLRGAYLSSVYQIRSMPSPLKRNAAK